jgi:hypothetical protein
MLLMVLLAGCANATDRWRVSGAETGAENTAVEAEPGTESTATETGEVVNEAGGFAFTLPEGWIVAVNEANIAPGAADELSGGITFLTPEDADPQSPDTAIILNTGTDFLLFVGSEDRPADASLDDIMAQLTADESGAVLSEPQAITLAGLEGRTLDMQLSDPALGEGRVRIIIAQPPDGRALTVLGFAPLEQWDTMALDTVTESLRLFEPTLEPTAVPTFEPTAATPVEE